MPMVCFGNRYAILDEEVRGSNLNGVTFCDFDLFNDGLFCDHVCCPLSEMLNVVSTRPTGTSAIRKNCIVEIAG